MNLRPITSLLLAACTAVLLAQTHPVQVTPLEIPLWSTPLQGISGPQPSMGVFCPLAAEAKDMTIVIVPGGGYGIISPYDRTLAEFFRSEGYPAVVIDYRVLPNRYPAALADVLRAIRLVKAAGHQWGLPTDKIVLLGESAGGQLAAIAATQPNFYRDPHDDLAATISARPDFLVLLYPVITTAGAWRHPSVDKWLGAEATDAFRSSLSPELHVTHSAPPAILFHAADDPIVPWKESLNFAAAYWTAGAPAELHIFPHGGHGHAFAYSPAISETWRSLLLLWLAAQDRN
jgi:acetyl esterase/lipase